MSIQSIPQCALVLALAFIHTCALAASRSQLPNIVIIFLDDSGWSDFHPFGDPPYPTPNVERLASQAETISRDWERAASASFMSRRI